MRNKQHYLNLLRANPGATVGFSLAAAAVYAARHGVCEVEQMSSDECRAIARGLRAKYGESLSGDDVRAEMEAGSASGADSSGP